MPKSARYTAVGSKISAGVLVAVLVALIAMATGVVLGVTLTGRLDSKATPLVVTVLGFIGLAIPNILNLLQSNATRQDLHNGLITDRVTGAVAQGVAEGQLAVAEDRRRTGARERAEDRAADRVTRAEGQKRG